LATSSQPMKAKGVVMWSCVGDGADLHGRSTAGEIDQRFFFIASAARRPASVIFTRATSIATTRLAFACRARRALAQPFVRREAMHEHDRLGAAISAGRQQFERAAAVRAWGGFDGAEWRVGRGPIVVIVWERLAIYTKKLSASSPAAHRPPRPAARRTSASRAAPPAHKR
jgi:hypothetical protein